MVDISVINEATVISDADVQAQIPALQAQWNEDLAPLWGLEQAAMRFIPKGTPASPTTWQFVYLDDSDQADALAYHDVTAAGFPICKVFVKTIQSDKSSVSVAASHELCEAAIDPTINLAAQDAQGVFWAYEVCDPVEDDQYGYQKLGVLVSDFILPSWFGYQDSAAPFDFQNKCKVPFQVLAGGYAQKFTNGWQQVTGKLVTAAHALVAPKGSRRDRRRNR